MRVDRVKALLRGVIDVAQSVRQLPSALKVDSRLRSSPRYLLYLCSQLDKTKRYADRVNSRSERLIGKLLSSLGAPAGGEARPRSVLCIGCRNVHEIELFQRAGYQRVTGVDLFTTDPRIEQMDMHALAFPDDSFDIVYSCHSLEHSFDPFKAASEFLRVARTGGTCVVEVPVRFRTSSTDLQDYGSVDGLRSLFEPAVGEVLFAEEEATPGGDVARLAFRVVKPSHAGVQMGTLTTGE